VELVELDLVQALNSFIKDRGMQSRFIEFMKEVPTVSVAIPVEGDSPEMCHLPFIKDQSSNYYILTSSLASHFTALESSNNACLLFVNPEEHPKGGHFAHERLKVQTSVQRLGKESEEYEELLEGFRCRYGKIVNLIAGLGDFHIFRFETLRGVYIQGFGAAYRLNQGEHLPSEHIRA